MTDDQDRVTIPTVRRGGDPGDAGDPGRRGMHAQSASGCCTRRPIAAHSSRSCPRCLIPLYPSNAGRGGRPASEAGTSCGSGCGPTRSTSRARCSIGLWLSAASASCSASSASTSASPSDQGRFTTRRLPRTSTGVLARHRKLMPTQHERVFHGIGAGDDLAVDRGRRRPGRWPDLLGEPDAAGPLCRLPRRSADLGRARPPMTATAGSPRCGTSRSSRARSWSRSRSSSRLRPSRMTSRCRCPPARSVRTRRRGVIEPTSGEVIAGPLYDEEGMVVADCDLRRGLHAKRWFDSVGHYSREDVLAPEMADAAERTRVSSPYHAGSRELQDRFDTRRLADRLDERFLSRAVIDDADRAFIERMDMFFLATADADGQPSVLIQGRRSRLRPRSRRAHGRVPELRRQRDVPVDGQSARRTHTWACCSSISSPPRPSRLRLNGVASDRRA